VSLRHDMHKKFDLPSLVLKLFAIKLVITIEIVGWIILLSLWQSENLYLSVCLPICLHICLFVSIYLSICLPVSLPACLLSCFPPTFLPACFCLPAAACLLQPTLCRLPCCCVPASSLPSLCLSAHFSMKGIKNLLPMDTHLCFIDVFAQVPIFCAKLTVMLP